MKNKELEGATASYADGGNQGGRFSAVAGAYLGAYMLDQP